MKKYLTLLTIFLTFLACQNKESDTEIRPIVRSLQTEGEKFTLSFFERMRDLKSLKYCNTVRHDCESMEYAFKQSFKTVFGNNTCFKHGFATDIFWHLNRTNNAETIERGIILMLKRILIIREFLLDSKVPDAGIRATLTEDN